MIKWPDAPSDSTINHFGDTEVSLSVMWPEAYTEPEIPLAVTSRWVRAELISDTVQDVVPF